MDRRGRLGSLDADEGHGSPRTTRAGRCGLAKVVAVAAIALCVPMTAGGGGSVLGTGGALEITQLLNHAELIKEVAQQAEQISNQIRQYTTMIQNLRQLPENWIGQVT